MEKAKKILKIIAVNVIVFILLLELVSLIIYYSKNEAFFYTHEATVKAEVEKEQDRQLTAKRFHPFFGFTYKPDTAETNNYGYNCAHDFPFIPTSDNQYIIGIFGGSVANGFYEMGRERLTEQLIKLPGFVDKEIIYLNFAMGGYKQPQQMHVLAHFVSIGQHFDLALNIDGFNEIMFCANNSRLNVDLAMPSAQHYLPLRDLMDKNAVTGKKLESIWEIRQIKKKYLAAIETLNSTSLASVYLVTSAYHKFLYKKYRAEVVRFDNLTEKKSRVESMINIKYTPAAKDFASFLVKVKDMWRRSSQIMYHTQLAAGNRYFHFLQPNQYYSKKGFSDEEKSKAINRKLPYNHLTQKGYPELVKELAAMKISGFPVFDATGIFDKVTETVYIDQCCHFNELGNRIFADFIAARLAKALL